MEGRPPQENYPLIGTVQNPVFFFDGCDLLLSYDVAPAAGGGVAILKFSDVIYFEKNAINVEGLRDAPYPIKAWDFTEVRGSERLTKWKALDPRFWTISFNDMSVEIVFQQVQLVQETRQVAQPSETLLGFLTA